MSLPEPYFERPGLTIYCGDALAVLREMPEESVQCVVTSPPYWGLRDYGVDGQLGLEPTPEEYVERMVEVFREVRRVLRSDGTLWLNLGDCYANDGKWGGSSGGKHVADLHGKTGIGRSRVSTGLKPKDLVGMPWRVAFALQADGWYLRSDIVWSKPNPMPESVTDRPTKAHEYVFLLTKSARYFYDAEAVREADSGQDHPRSVMDGQPSLEPSGGLLNPHKGLRTTEGRDGTGRNLRTVWTIATQPYPGAHFATFPPKLIEPCIKAGTSEKGCCRECGAPWERVVEKELVPTAKAAKTCVVDERDATADRNDQGSNRQKDGHMPGWINRVTTTGFRPTCPHGQSPVPCTVLDPFAGSGTTATVAHECGCDAILIEISEEYIELAKKRLEQQLLPFGATS